MRGRAALPQVFGREGRYLPVEVKRAQGVYAQKRSLGIDAPRHVQRATRVTDDWSAHSASPARSRGFSEDLSRIITQPVRHRLAASRSRPACVRLSSTRCPKLPQNRPGKVAMLKTTKAILQEDTPILSPS